jgi:hypothetical protein
MNQEMIIMKQNIWIYARTTIKIMIESIKFELIQFRFFRKLFKGSYYLMDTWITTPLWTQKKLRGCGAKILKEEHYN